MLARFRVVPDDRAPHLERNPCRRSLNVLQIVTRKLWFMNWGTPALVRRVALVSFHVLHVLSDGDW